jgi:hypothetical protein
MPFDVVLNTQKRTRPFICVLAENRPRRKMVILDSLSLAASP